MPSMSPDIPSLIFRCPQCGTYSDDPIKSFTLAGFAPAPQSEFFLFGCLCDTCETRFDLARLDDPVVIEEMKRGAHGQINQALLKRCHNAVNEVVLRKESEAGSPGGRIIEDKGSLEAEFEFLNSNENPNFERRQPIIPMEALALARGLRTAANQCPERIFQCSIGPLSFVLSVDQMGETSLTLAMHLSISRIDGGEPSTNLAIGVALTLFFSMEELRGDKGNIYEQPSLRLAGKEVKHYYIPWPIG